MFSKKNFALSALLALFLLVLGCSKTPGEKFGIGLEKAAAGDQNALSSIEELLLYAAAAHSFSGDEMYCDGEIVWTKGGGKINILFPKEGSFAMQSDGMNNMRAVDSVGAAFSDGTDIFVFGWDGKMKKRITAGTKREQVLALSVSGGTVYYFKNNKIYSAAENDTEGKLFVKNTFTPPYSKLFNSYMYARGNKLGLLLGVAGSYHFNIIDIDKGKTIATNVRMASPKLYLKEDSVLYIFGNTGNWNLTRFIFKSGSIKNYQRYRDIEDVEIFPDEIIVKNSSGIRIGSAGKEDITMPPEYKFKGGCGELALIRYN
ncbi:MAG: hypothetical protein LBT84_03790, partial [Spirochaetia bacterium]|nr:hypothetical protein [Spirochaetia bacterium]